MISDFAGKIALVTGLATHTIRQAFVAIKRSLTAQWVSLRTRTSTPPASPSDVKNVVVVGASFAGYFASRILATSLPRDGRYRVVVIEPNSHFNFTWVLPRFCVVEGHEHKAFIPYTPAFFSQAPRHMVRWVQDRVSGVRRNTVVLRSGEELPYEFLLIATGSSMAGPPSRLGVENKVDGIKRLKSTQDRIREAEHLVVAGGGAAGVELATDAKSYYPNKSVTLVHSRQTLMNRFGPELQKSVIDAVEKLGIRVVLGEKVQAQSADGKFVTLSSGNKLECDCLINCTGQKPASGLVAEIAPHALSPSGRIRVKPTLQIDDDSLPNVFACGDVAETNVSNASARTSSRQAEVAADNIALMARGKQPRYTYKPAWQDEVISLTLGLGRSITGVWDGRSELLFSTTEKDLTPMCERAWRALACRPFEDTGMYSDKQT